MTLVTAALFSTESIESQSDVVGRIVLQPNKSIEWREMKLWILGAVLVATFVGVYFISFGIWFLLPFVLLQLCVVLSSMYLVIRKTHRQQVVSMSADQIILESGSAQVESRVVRQRFYTKILVANAKTSSTPTRVCMVHRGESFEIGSFLSESDKRELVRDLRLLAEAADRMWRRVSQTTTS